MGRKYRIAVLPGDGIGQEVVSEATRVLRSCEQAVQGLKFEPAVYEAGARYWKTNGRKTEWTSGTFDACKKADTILLGADVSLIDKYWRL